MKNYFLWILRDVNQTCMPIQCLFIDFLINTTLEMTVYSFIYYIHYDMSQPVIAAIT